MEKDRYTRTEIYEMLWVQPTTKVAQLLGISDVGLGKWCKAYGVPKPKLGYWAKVQHGVEVPEREPLEPWWNEHEPSFTVNAIEKAKILARANLEKSEAPIWGIYKGNRFDAAIDKTFENFDVDRVSKFGRTASKQGFAVDISPKSTGRVKRVLQTLVTELKKSGYGTFEYKRYSNPEVTGFIKDGEKYSVSLYEASTKLDKPIKKKKTWSHNGTSHDYYETIEYGSGGKLELHLSHDDLYGRRTLKDSARASLESQLGKTLVIFNEMAVEAKAVREERERIELEQKIRDQKRLDKAWAIKVKEWRWEQLSSISQEWDQIQTIKRFIEAVQSNAIIPKTNEDYKNWLAWAKKEVDQRDAIKLAEEGYCLPGQGEPDREDFKVAYDWSYIYGDEEDDENEGEE
jgi:hypothetical protein